MDEICAMTRDLLPLYVEGLCSEESASVVEKHLGECPKCSAALAAMREEEVASPTPAGPVRETIKPFKKVRRHYRRILVIIVAVVVLAFPAYLTFNELAGPGMSFSSLAATQKAKAAFAALVAEEYDAAGQYFCNATGYGEEQMSAYLKDGFGELGEKHFTLTDARVYPFNMGEERVAEGMVGLTVRCGEEEYTTSVYVTCRDGHIIPHGFLDMFGPYGPDGRGYMVERGQEPEQIRQFETMLVGQEVVLLNDPSKPNVPPEGTEE